MVKFDLNLCKSLFSYPFSIATNKTIVGIYYLQHSMLIMKLSCHSQHQKMFRILEINQYSWVKINFCTNQPTATCFIMFSSVWLGRTLILKDILLSFIFCFVLVWERHQKTVHYAISVQALFFKFILQPPSNGSVPPQEACPPHFGNHCPFTSFQNNSQIKK